MTLPDPRSPSPAANGQQLDASVINSLAVSIQKAVDGVGGGTYANGSLLKFTGSFETSGTLTTSGPLAVTGALSLGAATVLTTNASATITLTCPVTATNLTMTSTNRVKVASRSITRAVEHAWIYTDADWRIDANGFPASQSTGVVAWLPLHLPDNCTITAVTVYLTPVGGHGGLPGTRPSIELFQDSTTLLPVSLGTATDSVPADVTAYQLPHSFGISGLSTLTVKATRRYKLKFTDESGGNSLAGMVLRLATVTYTCTEYDED